MWGDSSTSEAWRDQKDSFSEFWLRRGLLLGILVAEGLVLKF
jgi:hypothetical protein